MSPLSFQITTINVIKLTPLLFPIQATNHSSIQVPNKFHYNLQLFLHTSTQPSPLFDHQIKTMNTTTTTTTTTMTVPSNNINNPYLHTTPAPPPQSNNFGKKLDTAAKKAESFAGNLFNHLKTGPGFIDVAMTRLEQAGRVISDGGCKNVFKREFGDIHGEKFKNSFVCYLSTTTGPVLGTLYVSNMRIGFRSDNPVWTGASAGGGGFGMGQWVHYMVVVMVDQVLAVNPSGNPVKPGEKYVEVITKDGHHFWFMGFVFYDEALKTLYKAIRHSY